MKYLSVFLATCSTDRQPFLMMSLVLLRQKEVSFREARGSLWSSVQCWSLTLWSLFLSTTVRHSRSVQSWWSSSRSPTASLYVVLLEYPQEVKVLLWLLDDRPSVYIPKVVGRNQGAQQFEKVWTLSTWSPLMSALCFLKSKLISFVFVVFSVWLLTESLAVNFSTL